MPGSAQTSPFMLDVSNLVDARIEASIFRAVVTDIQPDAVRIKRTGQFAEDAQDYAACDVYPFPSVGDEVLVLRVGHGFIVVARIVREGIDVLHTGLADLAITGTLLMGPDGRIAIGDVDPETNGGVLIDLDEITVFPVAGDGRVTLNENGLTIVSPTGDAFFTLEGGTVSAQVYLSSSGGAAFGIGLDVAGTKCEVKVIEITCLAGLSISYSDSLGWGGTAIGALFMLHVVRTDTNASLGHIFGSGSAGQIRYVSNTNTEASSGGTVAPSVALNAGDGFDFTAHASFNTRFVGLAVVLYV